jgi:hypothetical protein
MMLVGDIVQPAAPWHGPVGGSEVVVVGTHDGTDVVVVVSSDALIASAHMDDPVLHSRSTSRLQNRCP